MNLSISLSAIGSGVALGVVFALPAQPLLAQPYSIEQVVIANGGGTSAGGGYSLTGTIGQPEAGAIGGDVFSLVGGFWSAPTTLGAPRLSIGVEAGNSVIISWPSTATGFTLQQSTTLHPLDWRTAPEAVTDSGTNRSILVSPPAGPRFYRLFRP